MNNDPKTGRPQGEQKNPGAQSGQQGGAQSGHSGSQSGQMDQSGQSRQQGGAQSGPNQPGQRDQHGGQADHDKNRK